VKLDQLLTKMWNDYTELNPKALEIYNLFKQKEEKVINDHVAFRTFNHKLINIDNFAKAFVDLGYVKKDYYEFKQKKLDAYHYEHADSNLPKIFISELRLEDFSDSLQSKVNKMIEQISPEMIFKPDFCISGRGWGVSFQDYQELKEESEYAAWLSAFGFRVNHFTVLVNALSSFSNLEELNTFIKSHGHSLNTSGGEIKGTPEQFLEQSSTLSYNQEIHFTDGKHIIPACYYEFAKRHVMPNGNLFSGFVAGSADKIFESTNKGQ